MFTCFICKRETKSISATFSTVVCPSAEVHLPTKQLIKCLSRQQLHQGNDVYPKHPNRRIKFPPKDNSGSIIWRWSGCRRADEKLLSSTTYATKWLLLKQAAPMCSFTDVHVSSNKQKTGQLCIFSVFLCFKKGKITMCFLVFILK